MVADAIKCFGLILINVIFVVGCATTPERGQPTESLYDGAAKTLYDAKHKPSTSKEAMELGNRALQVGDIDRALYRFVVAYELDPKEYEALHKVGVIHAQRGSMERAALAFELVLKQKPDNIATLLEMGLIEISRRRYQRAEDYLRRVVEAKPEVWRAHNGLGVLADLNKEFEFAQRHYKNALKLYPGSPALLNNMGYSHYLAGNWQRAREYLEAALDADPGYRQAWRNLGLIHVRQGAYDQAVAAFEHVMDKPQIFERIGTLCMVEGKLGDATRFLNLAVASSPTYYKKAYDNLERLKAMRDSRETRGAQEVRSVVTPSTDAFASADVAGESEDSFELHQADLLPRPNPQPRRFTLDRSVWR